MWTHGLLAILQSAQACAPLQRLEIAPDPQLLNNIVRRVGVLGQAYFFTGEVRYARRLVEKVRTFFLDENSGMLPSLAYAGMRPGIDEVGKPTVRSFARSTLLLHSDTTLKGSR